MFIFQKSICSIMVVTSLVLPLSKLSAQELIPLYPDGIPNSIAGPDEESVSYGQSDSIMRISNVSRPSMTVYLPPPRLANGTAVLICPGGGYAIEAASHEGSDVAQRLNEAGITAFVLKYRLPSPKIMKDPSIGPLQDAQRALQIIRSRAREWHIKKNRIGIMGFSAGGHLAASVGTHFDSSFISPMKKISLRPDFMVLAYPVISFQDTLGHMGSRNNLLGLHPSKESIDYFSNELQVKANTPAAFMVHAKDDKTVKVNNTLLFAERLRALGIPEEVFLYEKGGHGFGMHNKTSEKKWIDPCIDWIMKRKWKN